MNLEIKEFMQGILNTSKYRGGTLGERFLPEQYPAYEMNAMYKNFSRVASGVSIVMETEATFLHIDFFMVSGIRVMLQMLKLIWQPRTPYQLLPLEKKPGKPPRFKKDANANRYGEKGRRGSRFDLFIDDQYQYSVAAKGHEIDFDLKNPEHKKQNVQIYLPYAGQISLRRLEVDGVAKPVHREKILFLGDSITCGGNNTYSHRLYAVQTARKLGLELVNQGVSGYVYQEESLNGLDKLSFLPKYVVVAYGTNDWRFAPDFQCAKDEMVKYLSRLSKIFPATPIYVITPIWRADEKIEYPCGGMNVWRSTIQAETEKYEQMHVVDGASLVPHDTAYYQDGMLHPNDAGSDCYAANLADRIVKG